MKMQGRRKCAEYYEMKTQNPLWRWEEDGMTVTRTTPWTGPGCHNGCGILVYSKGNRVIKVEGDPETPFNQGRLCVRCLALPDVVHHPDRLTHPLKRVGKRGEGLWEKITWDEAYDTIVKNVRNVQRQYGPEAIAVLHGTGRNVWHLGAKLCYSAFGSPNLGSGFLSGFACYGPKIMVSIFTTGFLPTPDCGQMFPDRYENPNWRRPECLMVWGNNPVVAHSDSVRGDWFVELMKRGAKLIVIDPRLTWIASKADIWLQLRPGTDAALALGMLHVIIEEGLYDREFVAEWTYGFERLKDRVMQYPPESVAEICWVPKEKIIAAARLYAESRPAAIQWGVSVEQHKVGVSTLLAIQDLWAITGNLDVPGGNIISRPAEFSQIPKFTWGREELASEIKKKTIGQEQYPTVPIAHPDVMAETMMSAQPYALKMAWIQGTNPITCMAMEPRKIYQAFQNLEFVVVVDLFMTPSAMAFADIVLPAASALERNSIRADNYGRAWWGPFRAVNKIVQVAECKSDEEILLDLGKRLNPEAFPWANVEEMLDYHLRDTGLTFSKLRGMGTAPYYSFEYRKYEKGLLRRDGKPGFETTTGKLNLLIPQFERMGLDPLPYYEEPPQSPVSTPELARKYPFILTTGARSWAFFHSEHRQIPELREIHPDPMVEIHPDTARERGIRDGDWVWIENNYGRCRQRARLTDTIHPRVVNANHGWWFPERPGPEPSLFGVWESNINQLLPLGECGPSGWCAPYKSNICRVYRAKEGI